MESWKSGYRILIMGLMLSSCSMFVVNSSMQQTQLPGNQNPSSSSSPASINNHPTTQNHNNRALMPPRVPDPKTEQNDQNEEFLASHNKVRRHFNQPLFIWDPKLALYARQYAEKRSPDCNLIHSDGPFGENIFWGGGNQWKPIEVVRLWVREHRNYDRATNKCMTGKMCGHYTQIVWRDTVRLGCALLQCNSGDMFGICSYDPPGNYFNENPFNTNV